MTEYARVAPRIAATKTTLAALSVDEPIRSRALHEKLQLPFPLLCDPSRKTVEAYGLLNAEERGGIAYPAVVVISREGKLTYVSLDRMKERVRPDDVVGFLESRLGAGEVAREKVSPRLGDFGRVLAGALRFGIKSPRPEGAKK